MATRGPQYHLSVCLARIGARDRDAQQPFGYASNPAFLPTAGYGVPSGIFRGPPQGEGEPGWHTRASDESVSLNKLTEPPYTVASAAQQSAAILEQATPWHG